MDNTGRIRQPLDRRARAILFGSSTDPIDNELPYYVSIDRAHIVMLTERALLRQDHARSLLAAIDRLAASGYEPLRARPATRGSYLLYEDWLIETLGERIGGAVHIARSRNDINATVLCLRLRPVYRRLVCELLRLVGLMIRRAERHAGLVMPIYTHYQAALPITYGHYLAGVALALLRDLEGIQDASRSMDQCALGAGAAGGTAVPIDCTRTAQLLGFTHPPLHSIDAVASRDLVLRLLGASSVLAVTLSRVATDFQLWSTAEFDLIRFPDSLVGSSSMMPQKRNAFVLEHIKGRGAGPMGAFMAAATAMHGTPFSNSVAVGTEGTKHVWDAILGITEALVLTRVVVAGAEPQPQRMHERAVNGRTSATQLANCLVLDGGLSFRRAHHRVGDAVTATSQDAGSWTVAACHALREEGFAVDPESLDPVAVAGGTRFGGGPAGPSLAGIVTELRRRWIASAHALTARVHTWKSADRQLRAAVAHVRGETPGGQGRDLPSGAMQQVHHLAFR